MIAPKRSSVAGRMPPIIMSQISVVETSITPCIRPESMSFSIDLPPMPVAWKTSGSQSFSISFDDLLHARRRDAEHRHADERTLGGGAPAWVWRVLFDPAARHRAPWHAQPLPSTARETRLSPCMSVTECIIVTSVGPT